MSQENWWDEEKPDTAPSIWDRYDDTPLILRPESSERPSLIDSYDATPPRPKPKVKEEGPRHLSSHDLFKEWLYAHVHTAIFMTLGLLFSVGILTVGFWKTFLIALCLGTGYLYGSYLDGNPRLSERLRHFIEHWIDDNPLLK